MVDLDSPKAVAKEMGLSVQNVNKMVEEVRQNPEHVAKARTRRIKRYATVAETSINVMERALEVIREQLDAHQDPNNKFYMKGKDIASTATAATRIFECVTKAETLDLAQLNSANSGGIHNLSSDVQAEISKLAGSQKSVIDMIPDDDDGDSYSTNEKKE